MLARIEPRPLSGAVPAIASKSMAHRLIIAAALANGVTEIDCPTTCDDIEATVRCLVALGARVERDGGRLTVHPVPYSREHGILKALSGAELDCGESGSTLRFMLPVACALGARARFTGAGRLGERPLGPLADEIIAAGCDLTGLDSFPLATEGRMRPGRFVLPGDVSSQYVSGLLLAAPVLPGPSEILVLGRLESKPYVNLTLRALRAFGVEVGCARVPNPYDSTDAELYTVPSGGYRAPGSIAVEGDWSNAAFWLCAGALGTEPVSVTGLSLTSAQGDRNVLAALSRFGAKVTRERGVPCVRPDHLHAFTMSARDIPDLVPVIAAVAACAEGRTVIRDCARLRLKESDRLETTTRELRALGAAVRIDGDDLVIAGKPRLAGGVVEAHNDHRIAMMAAVAATRCDGEVLIHGAECVRKSYPAFFDHYRALGGCVNLEEEPCPR